MSDQNEALRRKIESTIKTWRETTPEGRAFCPSPYNVFVLIEDGVKRLVGGLTVANLTLAYRKLSLQGYDFSKDARPVKTIPYSAQAEGAPAPAVTTPAAEPEIPERELPGYPVRGGLEDGWQYSCRLQNWREQRAQQANRAKLNLAVPTTPHPDTVRRTKSDIRIAAAKLDLYRKRNP